MEIFDGIEYNIEPASLVSNITVISSDFDSEMVSLSNEIDSILLSGN